MRIKIMHPMDGFGAFENLQPGRHQNGHRRIGQGDGDVGFGHEQSAEQKNLEPENILNDGGFLIDRAERQTVQRDIFVQIRRRSAAAFIGQDRDMPAFGGQTLAQFHQTQTACAGIGRENTIDNEEAAFIHSEAFRRGEEHPQSSPGRRINLLNFVVCQRRIDLFQLVGDGRMRRDFFML